MEEPSRERKNITELLQAWQRGNAAALEELMYLAQPDLRRIARIFLRKERRNHTLETDGLVNEAYKKLDGQYADWQNRDHFFAIVSTLMRRVLVDYARARLAEKRPGDDAKQALEDADSIPDKEQNMIDLIALNEALTRLEKLNEWQAKIVEFRYFGNLSNEETAQALSVTVNVVKNNLRAAKAWLYKELTKKANGKNSKGDPDR